MSKNFRGQMAKLSDDSGYSYDFLVDLYNGMMDDPDDDGDWNYFIGVTMEHDW